MEGVSDTRVPAGKERHEVLLVGIHLVGKLRGPLDSGGRYAMVGGKTVGSFLVGVILIPTSFCVLVALEWLYLLHPVVDSAEEVAELVRRQVASQAASRTNFPAS